MISIDDVSSIDDAIGKIVCGDASKFVSKLPDKSVDAVVTSPPYWQQRDYGCDGQHGLEKSMFDYINVMFELFEDIKRVLKPKGSCWVNLGDCFNENTGGYFDHNNNDAPHIGKHRLKTEKYQPDFPRRSLLLVPYRFAIRMTDDGKWLCRNLIIWKKHIVQPTTAKNRFTIDFEPVFLFTKTQRYYFDKEAVKWIEDEDLFQEKRERRAVWELDSDHSGKTGHVAPYPIDLPLIPIMATCPTGGIVLDPFVGSGSTAVAARKLGRKFLVCDLSKEYCEKAERRLATCS